MSKQTRPVGQLRIIGGAWRGRKLTFAALPGLRPTPDRVRETLFNWLAMAVPGARCLDLFAGSGALGFEAASRGAKAVVLVESSTATARQLQQQIERLEAAQITLFNQSAGAFLQQQPSPFDVVFLDPPFGEGLLEPVLAQLASGWLHNESWLYIEAEKQLTGDVIQQWLPPGFEIYRSKQAGDVGYHLACHV